MFTHRGIAVDSFARIESDCSMTCTVVGDEAQFEFGDTTHCLNLIVSDEALEQLSTMIADAMAQFKAQTDTD
jgi:hypothetical protein